MTTIEGKISEILRTVKNSLSRKEMNYQEFGLFIENLLVEKKLLKNTRENLEAARVPYYEISKGRDLYILFLCGIKRKLIVKESYGVVQERYYYLESTLLSDEAKKDIVLSNTLIEKITERINPQVNGKSLIEEHYRKIVFEVGNSLFEEYDVDVSEQKRERFLLYASVFIRYCPKNKFNLCNKIHSTSP